MDSMRDDDEEAAVGSLARGLRLLSLFDIRNPEMSFVEIQSASGLPKATVHRLLKTLLQAEFILFDDFRRRYFPGPKVMTLGFASLNAFGLVDNARPFMQSVCREVDHTVGLTIRDGTDMVTCYRVLPINNIVNVNSPLGHRGSVARTGSGRLHLALDHSDDFVALAKKKIWPVLSAADRKILKAHVEFAGERGFSYSDEEVTAAFRSVTVPIWKFGDMIAGCLYVSAASSQISLENLLALAIPALLRASSDLSLILGASNALIKSRVASDFSPLNLPRMTPLSR